MMAEAAQKGPQVRQTLPAMMIATPLDLEAMDKVRGVWACVGIGELMDWSNGLEPVRMAWNACI
jgi:hypothetical protein